MKTCACADIFIFKYRNAEIFLLKLGSAKFNQKIPIRSEDINKMQTEFS